MDRSKQRGGGSEECPGTVRVSDWDLFRERSSGTNQYGAEGHYNAYAEASQAREAGRSPRPIDHTQSSRSNLPTGTDEREKVPTKEPAAIENQYQRADVEAAPIEAANSTPDDRSNQTDAAKIPRLMKVTGVAAYLEVSVSQVWRSQRRDPDFPRPIRIGSSTRWDRSELDRYVEVRKSRRRNGR